MHAQLENSCQSSKCNGQFLRPQIWTIEYATKHHFTGQ